MGLSVDFGAPVNTVLLLGIIYYTTRIIFPPISAPKQTPDDYKKGYSWMPKQHPPTALFQTFTPKTLVKYKGKDNERILLAIKGKVFDVTAGRSFYGPGALAFFIL